MTRGVWALCMAVALTACADRTGGKPYGDAVTGWVVRSDQQLIAEWGDPTESTPAAKGGKLLVYKTRFYINNTNSWSTCTTRFQVDEKGEIVATKIERENGDLGCDSGGRVSS
jgi:hypothetical protein